MIDLLVIGGGINGAGIANEAAGRGLSVVLCEQNDLASATSSASSKLIHGGLRYLEHYEFRLVRESLQERSLLLQIAPHIISPLQFFMPHNKRQRSAWLIRLGLWLYDHLAGRKQLARSKSVKFAHHIAGVPLKDDLKKGFSYYDCSVDDSRLVICNALAAEQNQAEILTNTKFLSATRESDHWVVQLLDAANNKRELHARCIINAAGPWVKQINNCLQLSSKTNIRLVQGSHIVVDKLYEGHHAYILQNEDGRIVFVFPYDENYSVIGTTDVEFHGDPSHVTISQAEIAYLCQSVNHYFKQSIQPDDVISHWSGLRPLLDNQQNNPAEITRDYLLEFNCDDNKAPVISIFGGKITTYRKLAENTLELLKPYFPSMRKAWTSQSILPGGDITQLSLYIAELASKYPWLNINIITRFVRCYGTRCTYILSQKNNLDDMGIHFGVGLFQAEVEYLMDEEWATTADDVVWRRTKLGLYLSPEEKINLETWMTYRNA